ncbi:hypothetical protein F511_30437 [Dorcoceras hygrometricum]|uniref:Uncharacterized protein n=1 Tax=Dorcoceras hygrometricum TaxID=472368 RepID=A0A2Z7D7D6_9LAMI|nr:hypothetical protein F511_30437 [Dorcoceras hygrometricum]
MKEESRLRYAMPYMIYVLAKVADPDPISRGRSGSPRPETRILRQSTLEELTNFATDGITSKRRSEQVRSQRRRRGGGREVVEGEEGGTCITDSACKNQSVVVSVQYGPFNTYIPIRSTTIDSIGYPRMKASGESSTTKHRLLHASRPHPIPPPYDPKEYCDVLSMQIDSDLVIYPTTLVRTFQVVTICRVDKSEVLVVLISPTTRNVIETLHDRRLTLTRLPTHLGSLVLSKDLEYTKAYVRCDSGYDGYHETHLIVAVYSEHVPSRLGRQNEDKAARVRD